MARLTVAALFIAGGACGKSSARPPDGGAGSTGTGGVAGSGGMRVDAPQDLDGSTMETGAPDLAPDAGTDAAADAPEEEVDPDPTLCSNTRRCEPTVESCTEDESRRPPAGVNSCGTRWDCYPHYDDGTLEHPCPAEETDFCGCDGVTFSRPWFCADRPYDHIGACGDGYSCDLMRVQCSDPEPSCPAGQRPAVVNNCWGPCIPLSDCRCDFIWQCAPTDLYTCSGFPTFRCIRRNLDGGTDTPSDGATD